MSQDSDQILQNNIAKAKKLLILLNDSLTNLFDAAAARVQSGEKTPESRVNFEEQFEEFFLIADQIELNLVTALKCIQQADISRKFSPLPVNITPQPNSLTYDQFLKQTKAQIDYTKEMKSLLSEF